MFFFVNTLYLFLHCCHPVTFGSCWVQSGKLKGCSDAMMIPAFCPYRHPGSVMIIGVNTDIAKACGIVFTIITLTVHPHPASSGKRITIIAKSGRNTGPQKPRYSCWN